MSTWNNGPYPQQGPYGGPQYPNAPGYPPPGGYPPPQAGGYPPQAGGYPPQAGGYPPPPAGGYPPPGFQPPPPTAAYGDPYAAPQPGENAPFYNHTGMYGGAPSYEDGEMKGFGFSDASIRRGFIRKVYSILMCQLSITLAFIAWFLYHEPTRRFVYNNSWLFILALVVVIVAMITLACCGEVRRKAPTNYILLGVFTLAESFLLGVTSASYQAVEVLMAVGITAAVCLALTLFAFQTKYDFTMCGGFLLVSVVILLIFGIVAIFVHNRIVSLVYASLGALIFSMYLVYDTQMMMGGSHKYSISPEEYVFAALNLYVDVINIFIYILTIIGASRD